MAGELDRRGGKPLGLGQTPGVIVEHGARVVLHLDVLARADFGPSSAFRIAQEIHYVTEETVLVAVEARSGDDGVGGSRARASDRSP